MKTIRDYIDILDNIENNQSHIVESEQLDEGMIDNIASFIQNQFKKAAYVSKTEIAELQRALSVVKNWNSSTPEQKEQAKKDLLDIAQFVLASVGTYSLTSAAMTPGVAAAGQLAHTTAGQVAEKVIHHIIMDGGPEALAALFGSAGIGVIKKAIHDVTSTSAGQRWDKVMGKRQANLKQRADRDNLGFIPKSALK